MTERKRLIRLTSHEQVEPKSVSNVHGSVASQDSSRGSGSDDMKEPTLCQRADATNAPHSQRRRRSLADARPSQGILVHRDEDIGPRPTERETGAAPSGPVSEAPALPSRQPSFTHRYHRVTTYIERDINHRIHALRESGAIQTMSALINAALRDYLSRLP